MELYFNFMNFLYLRIDPLLKSVNMKLSNFEVLFYYVFFFALGHRHSISNMNYYRLVIIEHTINIDIEGLIQMENMPDKNRKEEYANCDQPSPFEKKIKDTRIKLKIPVLQV